MKDKRSLLQRVAGVFADNSPLMTQVGRIALLAELNVCFLLSCLPLVTAGAALTALYTALFRYPDLGYGSALKLYWKRFARALVPTLGLWLVCLLAISALTTGWYAALTLQLTNNFALMLPLLLGSALTGFLVLWLFPRCALQLDREEPVRFVELLSSSLLLGLGELIRSVALLALSLASPLLLLLALPKSSTLVGVWCLFGCAPFVLYQVRLLRPVLCPEPAEAEDEAEG